MASAAAEWRSGAISFEGRSKGSEATVKKQLFHLCYTSKYTSKEIDHNGKYCHFAFTFIWFLLRSIFFGTNSTNLYYVPFQNETDSISRPTLGAFRRPFPFIHVYKRACPSVVQLVRRSVRNAFAQRTETSRQTTYFVLLAPCQIFRTSLFQDGSILQFWTYFVFFKEPLFFWLSLGVLIKTPNFLKPVQNELQVFYALKIFISICKLLMYNVQIKTWSQKH